jgi:hypothetical protein
MRQEIDPNLKQISTKLAYLFCTSSSQRTTM